MGHLSHFNQTHAEVNVWRIAYSYDADIGFMSWASNCQSATNSFHPSNKLVQGGFGPVYKGKLHDCQEIAVKRLSRASGQDLEEFINEVVVISKLQESLAIFMSPKYAMQELFSEKSDVFSFGVLLLEIVSGRRNSSF
ncbi:hypothetical protein JHK87_050450 [Glycine soja]|nr:hypothetical protein JHK87_050450 [Glycine soja]